MKTHWDEPWDIPTCKVRAVDPEGSLCYGYFEPEIGPEDLKGGWVLHPKSGYDTSDWKNSMQTKEEYKARREVIT